MIWFTADTHFNELRRLHYETPFDNVQQKNKYLTICWNRDISPCDTVYIAGDIGDYRLLRGLNGNIIIVLGNHDREFLFRRCNGNLKKLIRYLKFINPKIKIAPMVNYAGISIPSDKKVIDLLIIHEPYLRELKNLKSLQDHMYLPLKKLPYHEKNGHEKFVLFGHIHNLVKLKKYGLNVGCENYWFRPVPITKVIYYYKGLKNGLFHADVTE